jgi:hypothetical protein
LPQPQKKVVTCFILFLSIDFFIAFLGVLYQGEFKNTIYMYFFKQSWAHHKKFGGFFVRFFLSSLGCFARFFFIAFLGVRNKGSSKTRLKKIAGNFPQPPKTST